MTMEIKTCEQYMLAQLFDQQDENDIRRCRRTLLDLWKLIGKEI